MDFIWSKLLPNNGAFDHAASKRPHVALRLTKACDKRELTCSLPGAPPAREKPKQG
jgi:hypothetical protein